MRTRSFYVMTLRANTKNKDLMKFLEKEWVPALKSCSGCLEAKSVGLSSSWRGNGRQPQRLCNSGIG